MATHCMGNCHRDYLASVAIIITQLTFDRNENYLRYLIRMQQFPCRDRATPDNLLYAEQALYPLSLRDWWKIERTYPLFTRIVYARHPSDY